MELLTPKYYESYKKQQRFTLYKHLRKLSSKQVAVFPQIHTSSIFSSLIEGSGIDMDAYQFNKESKHNSPEMQQIDDLIEAYSFAGTHALNFSNLLKAHAILSKHFSLKEKYKGTVRDKEITVGNRFFIVYKGASPEIAEQETKRLFKDIAVLRKRKLTTDQVFYYAALIHLVFVKIHPFADGNGRAARLLEKWFMAHHLGAVVWSIPSEANYYSRRSAYYENLKIGNSYETVNYERSLPFLLMLPSSFSLSKKFYTFN